MEDNPFPNKLKRYVDYAVKMNNERNDFVMKNRVVSIFLKKSTPVLITMNKRKTHPRIKTDNYRPYTCTIHAELAGVIALHNLHKDADAVLVVRGDGTLASMPCPICQAVLHGAGIHKFYASAK